MLFKMQHLRDKKDRLIYNIHLKVYVFFTVLSTCKFNEYNVMLYTVIIQLTLVRWHYSQFDGFLCLTSVSKRSADHSQRLPLDRDANRALTDPVPPSL